MAEWKKVLISGSHFSVRNLKIDSYGAADTSDSFVFANSPGAIRTETDLKLVGTTTASFSGGTFSGSFYGDGSTITGVSAQASNALLDGPGIIFVNGGGYHDHFQGAQERWVVPQLKGTDNAGTNFPYAGS